MIRSFKCKETEKIWHGNASRRFPRDIQNRALSKLRQLAAATIIDDLKIPNSNRLESLKGDRKNQWSIRINQQWRICFNWNKAEALNIEIVDYH
ncbi:MAG: type II toxin-antitoxin system RelE/ParE family toxin [Alphaproteobacteria bacterium]